MKNELITVIVPVYKAEQFLRRCIDSILAQTYENLEVILIDDGSPDFCPRICDEYARRDSRIKVIHQQNAGPAAARNAGLDRASGAYIAFVDSDDYIEPQFLSKLYLALTEGDMDIAACDYFRVDEKSMEIEDSPRMESDLTVDEYGYWELANDSNLMIFTSCCNKLYKADLWAKERVDRKAFAEDASTLVRIIAKARKIRIIRDKLYCYRLNPAGLTKTYTVKNLEGVEIGLQRCEYFLSSGMELLVKNTLIMCANRLHYARLHLNLRENANRKRYDELRAWMRRIYRRAPKKLEFSREWFYCTLFCLSDNLYEFAYYVKWTIKGRITKWIEKD